MSIRWSFVHGLVLIGLALLAVGQNPPAQNPPAQNTGEGPSATRSVPAAALSGMIGVDTQFGDESGEDLPRIPAMLGGRGASLAFVSELERSNYLRGGVNVGAGYEDNPFLASGRPVGTTIFSVFPNIAIEESTSRMRFSSKYEGGITVNERLPNNNRGSHDLSFDSEFRLSPHVNLRAAENFYLTSGIFGTNTLSAFQPGAGGSNGTLITPLANQLSSQTVVETNYHFALKDVVGASGSLYALRYSDVATGPGTTPSGTLTTPYMLENTQTASGTAFWLHELFRRDWGGFGYVFERITFDPSGETRVQTFAAMDTLSLSKTFSVSAFIGPQYSENQGLAATGPNAGQLSTFNNWSLAGGVEGNWQKERTSVTAGYSKRVSDGGGLLGVVGLQNVHAAIRREFLPGWAATLGTTYGNNQAITLIAANNATSIKTTSVGASLERNIGRSLGFRIDYFHDLQSQSGSSAPAQNFDANRNRYSVTLSYQWAKPLGR
jgi:hypothetical protein